MAAWKLFNRNNNPADKSPAGNTGIQPESESVTSAPAYNYCSFCGQKYKAGTKHYCSVNDLIKYDLK